ncbi:MAG: UbiA family prenyltransferase [Candidatus Riflebacteria bacterium]|nr:UbiA family prenyltransferase [Candidatus Riflebacteria bacterium]
MEENIIVENKAEPLWSQLQKFFFAYLKSMRLYYAFITGIAGWIGVSFYFRRMTYDYHKVLGPEDYQRSALILVILFGSWGINQIFNDWLGIPEDRINAPNRPMVSGELNVKWALTLSCTLMGIATFITYFLNPYAVIPITLGFILNFVYNYSKAWGLWGNVIFGLMISNCTFYGFLASGPTPEPFWTSNRLCGIFLVALMNGLMTYYTYFKDYEGDKAAGKDTFIVRHGIEFARVAGIFGAFLPTLSFFFFRWMGWFPFPYTQEFIYCGIMTFFLQLWTAYCFYYYSVGPRAYYSNVTNFRACACGQVTMIAIFNGTLALYLFGITYVFIGFLFDLHSDHRA